jgi:hypothetical protein
VGWRKRRVDVEACVICKAAQLRPCVSITATDLEGKPYRYRFHVHDVPSDLELRVDEEQIDTERLLPLGGLLPPRPE